MVPVIFVVNCTLFLACVALCCFTFASHASHIFNPPAQIVVIRFALIFVLTAVSFFLQYLSTELTSPSSTEAIAHDMVEEVVTGIVEPIMLYSFFFLLVVHVGGTDRALHLFAHAHRATYRTTRATTLLTPMGSPDERDAKANTDDEDPAVRAARLGCRDYARYRAVLSAFSIVRPIVSIAMVLNRWYNVLALRIVLASINITSTLAVVVALMLTMQRLFPAIHASFLILPKFFVVKGLLLVRSFQWATYCLLVHDFDDDEILRVYYSGCLVESLVFCIVFLIAFRPATFRPIDGPFAAKMGFATVWDVMMDPVPACQTSSPPSKAISTSPVLVAV
ncbi:Aste57867_20077 [Aphanomyces stellatus]|uniref:Aste57867_20077 protein n=1 Tax=Aphanomyces stellatus TaxID=120398 RepID=A0A485LE40_9STRA|nr:hypothetical protein As57867_020011 [Aphanomyces stellatus]VFT96772.1 Aste57867_20077 [Aphanomyces stellatus]